MRDEEIVDLLALALEARLDRMVAEEILPLEMIGGVACAQLIGMAELVGAENDLRRGNIGADRLARGGAEAGSRRRADPDFGEFLGIGLGCACRIIDVAEGILFAQIIAARDPQFGREIAGPVRIDLAGKGVLALALNVKGRGITEIQPATIHIGGLRPARGAIGELGVVVIRDVPVEPRRPFAVRDRGGCRNAERRKAIERLQGLTERIECRGAEGRGIGKRDVARGRRRRTAGHGGCLFEGFIGTGNEQPVLDEGRADEPAEIAAAELVVDRAAIDRVAVEEFPVGLPEPGALDLVGAALVGHCDRTAGEIALFGVEFRDIHRNLLDRVERDRAANRWQAAGIEAEIVLGAHAINGDAVGARDRARNRNAAVAADIQRRQRVAAHDVAQIAVDRRDALDPVLIDAIADRKAGSATRAITDHDDFLDRGLLDKLEIHAEHVTKADKQILGADALVTRCGNLNLIGTANPQAGRHKGTGIVR